MRIILYTGKGGVGKTSISAATGLALAEQGLNTLVMSIDPAHSLSDAFDLDRTLMDHGIGGTVQVAPNLEIQEVQIQEEIRHHWKDVHAYITTILQVSGIEGVVADELAIFPGMEEICSLLYINQYARDSKYDVVLLDCAPTGESIRFISVPKALDWYMSRIFKLQRGMAKIARPILKQMAPVPLPQDSYFDNIERLFERLEGIDAILHDPGVTSVRLVTNPEKMVIKETQRAFMYFCLYGLTIDAVIVNRILPSEADGLFMDKWRRLQERYLRDIEETFSSVPIWRVPLFDGEVLGTEGLRRLAGRLYSDIDPAEAHSSEVPIQYVKEDGEYRILLRLPYVKAADVGLSAFDDEIVVSVGSFRRYVALPRHLMGLRPGGARRRGEYIEIYFPPRDHSA